MSISEQVRRIRTMSSIIHHGGIKRLLNEAADTIEVLSAKVVEENTKKSDASGWVSCDESLPEELEDVLVWYEYFRYGDYNCMYQTYGIGYQCEGRWGGDVSGTKAKCIAWQPLPEPYMRGGD